MPKRKAAKNKRGGVAKKESIQSSEITDVVEENVAEESIMEENNTVEKDDLSLSQEEEKFVESAEQQVTEKTAEEFPICQEDKLKSSAEVIEAEVIPDVDIVTSIGDNIGTNNAERKDMDSVIENRAEEISEPLETCLELAENEETEQPEKIAVEVESDVYEVKGAEDEEDEVQYIDEEAEEEQQALEIPNDVQREDLTNSLGLENITDSQFVGYDAKNEGLTNSPCLGMTDSPVISIESQKDSQISERKSKPLETESNKFEEISEGSIDQAEQEEVINDMATDVIITGVTFKSKESHSKFSKSDFSSRKTRVPYSEAESLEEVFFATENDDLKMPAEDKDNDDISDSSFSDHVGTNLSLEEISDDDLEPSKKRRKSLGPSLDKNACHEKPEDSNRSAKDSLLKSEPKEKGNEIQVENNKRPASNEDSETAVSKRLKLSEEKDGLSNVDSAVTKNDADKAEQAKEGHSLEMKLKTDNQDKLEESASVSGYGGKSKKEERSPTEMSKLRNISGGRISTLTSKQDQYDSKDRAPISRDYPDQRRRYEMVHCATQTESKILKGKIVQCNINPIDPYFRPVKVDSKTEDKFQNSKLFIKYRHLLPASIPTKMFTDITSVKPAMKAHNYTFSMGPVTMSDMDSHEFRDVAVKGADKFHLTFDTHCQGIFQSTHSKYENIANLIKRLKRLELGNRYMCMSFTYNLGQGNKDEIWKATILFMYEQDIQLETIGLVCDEKIRSKLHLRGLPKGVSKDFINLLFPEALSVNTISGTNEERVVSLGFSNTKLVEEILTCYDLVLVNGCQVKMTQADSNDVLIQTASLEDADVIIINEDSSVERCELPLAREKKKNAAAKATHAPVVPRSTAEAFDAHSLSTGDEHINSKVDEPVNTAAMEKPAPVTQPPSSDVKQGDDLATLEETVVTKAVTVETCKEEIETKDVTENNITKNVPVEPDLTVVNKEVEKSEGPMNIDLSQDGLEQAAACAQVTNKPDGALSEETDSSKIEACTLVKDDHPSLGGTGQLTAVTEAEDVNQDHPREVDSGLLTAVKENKDINQDQPSEMDTGQLNAFKEDKDVNLDEASEVDSDLLNAVKESRSLNMDQLTEVDSGLLLDVKESKHLNQDQPIEVDVGQSNAVNQNQPNKVDAVQLNAVIENKDVNMDQHGALDFDPLKANKENKDVNLEDVSDEDTINQSKHNVLAVKENLIVVNIDLTNEDSDSSEDMKDSAVTNTKLSGDVTPCSAGIRPEKEKLEMTDGSLLVSMEVIDVIEDESPEKIAYFKYDKTLPKSSGQVIKKERSSGEKWKTESWTRAPQEHRRYDTYHPPTYSKYPPPREEYLPKPSSHYQKRHSREVSESKKMSYEEPSRYPVPSRESTAQRRDGFSYDVRSRSPSPRKDSSWYRESDSYRHSRLQYPLDYVNTSRKYPPPSASYDKWQPYYAEGSRKPELYSRHGTEARPKDWPPRSAAYTSYSTWQDHRHATSRSGGYYLHEKKESYQGERKYVQRRSRSQSYSDMSSSPDHHSPVKRKWSSEKKSPKRSLKHTSRSPISISSRSRSLSPVSKSPSVGRTQYKNPVKEALVNSVKQFLHIAKDLRESKQQMRSISPESCSPVRTRSPMPVRTRSPVPLRTRSPVPVRSRSPGPIRVRSPGPVRSRSPLPVRARSPGPYRVPSPVLSPQSPHRFEVSRSRHILSHSSPRAHSRSPPPVRLRSSRSPNYSKSMSARHNRSPSPGTARHLRSPSPGAVRHHRSPSLEVARHHRSPSPEAPRHRRSPSPGADSRSKRYKTKMHEYSESRRDSYHKAKESSRRDYNQRSRPSSSPVKEPPKTGQWSDQRQYSQSGDQQWQQSYSSYQSKSATGPPPTSFNPNYPPPSSYPSSGYPSQETPSMYQGGGMYQYSNPSQYSYANMAPNAPTPYMTPTPAPPMAQAYQQAFNVLQSAMASQLPQQTSFEPSSSNKSSSAKNKKSWSMGSNALVFQRILSNDGGKKNTQSGTIEKVGDRSRQERPKQTKDVRCLTNVQVNK